MSVGERYESQDKRQKTGYLTGRYWEVLLGGRHCVEPRISLLFLFLSFLELMNVLLFFLYLQLLSRNGIILCISRRESQLETGNTYIYQEDWIGSSLALASASPMLPPCCYYLLVTSFSSSSSSSSSTTLLLSSSE